MVELNPKNRPLPKFRDDLQLFQGPDEPDGSPTYSLFDPVRRQYFKVSWGESLIIKNMASGMTAKDLCEVINGQSTLNVTEKEIENYFEEAARHNLLALPRSSGSLIQEAENRKQNPFKWLIFHYLYIRIPLINPNDFLEKTLKYVKPLASRTAFAFYTLLSVIGIGILFVRAEEFFHTFLYFFTLKGMVTYGLALTGVKVVHELAHAYTAVNFKVRVPSMGVIFLVLWPVLFTDVTDAWKLKNRKHRLYISLAGIVVETVIAGLCTFFWAFAPPGLAKSVFFVISAVSWGSTLLVNANPVMRFDGYYVLSDLWGIDNLQSRAFAVTRWKFREWILGLNMPCPVARISPERIRGMIVYSVCTWVYRLILYTALAVFVYVSFTKVIGITLFAVEIGFFILWPILSELKILYHLKSRVRRMAKLFSILALFCLALMWLAIPFQRNESFPAITVPNKEQILYVPNPSVIQEVYGKRNKVVKKGEVIVRLQSKFLEAELLMLTAEAKMVKQQAKIFGLDSDYAAHIPEKVREFEGIMAKRKAIQEQLNGLTVKAAFDGVLVGWEDNLRVGQAVAKDQVLGKVADFPDVNAAFFIPESLADSVFEGQEVVFRLYGGGDFTGKVEKINPVSARKLLYPSLASANHGELPVTVDKDKNFILKDTYFPVTVVLDVEGRELRYGRIGTVRVEGPKRSILASLAKDLVSIFWRESGF